MMDIKELKVTVGEVCEGYFNDAEEGVVGYNDRLDIRPKYQREFVYKDNQRDEVIRTVLKGLPLNVIYWCKVKKDDGSDGFEVLDGQQRTISLCEYVDGSFSVDDKYFYNLPKDQKDKILNYPLFVYVCDGTDSEKLDWFRIINIAGEKLTDQELRNAVYAPGDLAPPAERADDIEQHHHRQRQQKHREQRTAQTLAVRRRAVENVGELGGDQNGAVNAPQCRHGFEQ